MYKQVQRTQEDMDQRTQEYEKSEVDRIKRKKEKLPAIGTLNEDINKAEEEALNGTTAAKKQLADAMAHKKTYYEGKPFIKR